MMIKTNNNFGNFAYSIEAEVSDAQRDVLAEAGLTWVLQRTPASAAEKEMAGYDKRPEGFKRGSIAYSEALAAVLKKHLESAKLEVGKDANDKPIVQGLAIEATVSLYTPTTSEAKFTEEKAKWALRKSEGALATLAKNVGYTGDLEENGEAPKAFLVAIRTHVKAAALAALKGV